ncbi:MAG: hypothetical protein NTZ34_03410 [Chloroflexi bacterium]|nr:hypothetical protein [Chloroflexota bacterium]
MDRDILGRPSDLHTENRKITWGKTGILLLIIFCISGATIAWTSPPVPTGPLSQPALSTPSTPEEARVEVTAIVADRVEYGQALHIIMTVTNNGDIPVKNAHLFCNANPGGYFVLRVVDQAFVEMDRNNIDISIDDLSPGSQKDINLFLQAPMPGQILGEWSHNFHYDFTIKHDVASKSPVGTITLITRHGKILVIKSGFAQ